jgi:hypothetical protein
LSIIQSITVFVIDSIKLCNKSMHIDSSNASIRLANPGYCIKCFMSCSHCPMMEYYGCAVVFIEENCTRAMRATLYDYFRHRVLSMVGVSSPVSWRLMLIGGAFHSVSVEGGVPRCALLPAFRLPLSLPLSSWLRGLRSALRLSKSWWASSSSLASTV